MANAMANGSATKPTVTPAAKSPANWRQLYSRQHCMLLGANEFIAAVDCKTREINRSQLRLSVLYFGGDEYLRQDDYSRQVIKCYCGDVAAGAPSGNSGTADWPFKLAKNSTKSRSCRLVMCL